MNQPTTVDDIVQKVRETATEQKLEQLDAVARKMVAAEADVAAFLRAIHSRRGMLFYMNSSAVGAPGSTLKPTCSSPRDILRRTVTSG